MKLMKVRFVIFLDYPKEDLFDEFYTSEIRERESSRYFMASTIAIMLEDGNICKLVNC